MRRAPCVCVVSTAAAYYVLYTLSKEIFHKFRRIVVVFFLNIFFVVPLDLAESSKCKYLFKPVSYTTKKNSLILNLRNLQFMRFHHGTYGTLTYLPV